MASNPPPESKYQKKLQSARDKKAHHQAMHDGAKTDEERAAHKAHLDHYAKKEEYFQSAANGKKDPQKRHEIRTERANHKKDVYAKLVKETEEKLKKLREHPEGKIEEIKTLEINLEEYKRRAGYHADKHKMLSEAKDDAARKALKETRRNNKKQLDVHTPSHHKQLLKRNAHFVYAHPAHAVQVTGNWIHFKEAGVPLDHVNGRFEKTIEVPMTHILFKFRVQHDAHGEFKWEHDPSQHTMPDGHGSQNNVMDLSNDPSPNKVSKRQQRQVADPKHVGAIDINAIPTPPEPYTIVRKAGGVEEHVWNDSNGKQEVVLHTIHGKEIYVAHYFPNGGGIMSKEEHDKGGKGFVLSKFHQGKEHPYIRHHFDAHHHAGKVEFLNEATGHPEQTHHVDKDGSKRVELHDKNDHTKHSQVHHYDADGKLASLHHTKDGKGTVYHYGVKGTSEMKSTHSKAATHHDKDANVFVASRHSQTSN